MTRAAEFVGVPYRARGRTPDGWDCWGCVRYARQALFGLQSPCWGDTYSLEQCSTLARMAETAEQLVRASLERWRPVERRPGAVALVEFFKRPAHVGLMLEGTEMLHALGRAETVIEPVTSHRLEGRILGFYDA